MALFALSLQSRISPNFFPSDGRSRIKAKAGLEINHFASEHGLSSFENAGFNGDDLPKRWAG
jgi:hypothetical protein